MNGRPEILFPLFADLTGLAGIGTKGAQHLAKASIEYPRDLLLSLPHSLIFRPFVDRVENLKLPTVATISVRIIKHIPNTAKNRPYRIEVHDAKSSFYLFFFHPNAQWLRRNYPIGEERLISGKLEVFDKIIQMVHPDYVCTLENKNEIPTYDVIYPLTAGITQKIMRRAITDIMTKIPTLSEWITPAIISKYNWPSWNNAITIAHAPKLLDHISPHSPHRQRLAYDELLSHQVTLAIARHKIRHKKGRQSKGDQRYQNAAMALLPFALTTAQIRSIDEIITDMAMPTRMNRLLQGDVGTGKTLVAFMAMLNAVEVGGQAVLMVPTEILAYQHHAVLSPLAKAIGITLDVLTGADKGSKRHRKLSSLVTGETNILIGTHAVFQSDVMFNDLRLAVIDEQHRFGVRQRMDLTDKGISLDILVMTATPIPRSLALSHYGDMDLSLLDEKITGRKPIETVMVSNTRIEQVVARLCAMIETGAQAYWVCPLIEESDRIDLAAADERRDHLSKILGDQAVGLIHGRLSVEEKSQIMNNFQNGSIKILVATTVIEVGVDVPNATIMIIEHAERFGLAQLHQLRGRVGRGVGQSSCVLLYAHPLGETARKRLEAIRETNDGFKISEIDLALRGAGDLLGTAQSGLPHFRVADLETQGDLLALAQDEARLILYQDPNLKTAQGQAIRQLLYLMGADHYIKMLTVG